MPTLTALWPSFKHLAWFRERLLAKNAPFVGVVLYTGEQVLRLGQNLWAVPLHVLGSD